MCHSSTCNVFNSCRRIYWQIFALTNATFLIEIAQVPRGHPAGPPASSKKKIMQENPTFYKSKTACLELFQNKSSVTLGEKPNKTRGKSKSLEVTSDNYGKPKPLEGNRKETLAKRHRNLNFEKKTRRKLAKATLRRKSERNPCKT